MVFELFFYCVTVQTKNWSLLFSGHMKELSLFNNCLLVFLPRVRFLLISHNATRPVRCRAQITLIKCRFFEERGKPEYPGENLSEQRRELNPHIWLWVWKSDPGHVGERRVLSPLRHHCLPPLCLLKSAYVLSRVIRGITGGEWGGRRVFPISLSVSMWAPSAPFFFLAFAALQRKG